MKRAVHILLACIAFIAAFSCSTTRVLQDGDYRLARNKVTITNDSEFNPNSLEAYLKQKPNPAFILGWNPFLYVYNWSNGRGKAWDKIVQSIGVEPVVYDSTPIPNTFDSTQGLTRFLSNGSARISSIDSLYLILGPIRSAGISLKPSGIQIFITQGIPVSSASKVNMLSGQCNRNASRNASVLPPTSNVSPVPTVMNSAPSSAG